MQRSLAPPPSSDRTMSLVGAVLAGVGAIVGGGILVLGGSAFRVAGSGALLALALNGVVALLTALTFAEMSSAFPLSGGAYVFAKKVLDVRAAFVVGWVLWFAYIAAGVLYALGFAEFTVAVAHALWADAPAWLDGRATLLGLAVAATAAYTAALIRSSGSGGDLATWGKLAAFALLIALGLASLVGRTDAPVAHAARELMPHGAAGLLQAMGFTFIALQGFEVIAAVAGEVRDPERALPRAIIGSLLVGLAVYLPLLFVAATAGVPPGGSLVAAASARPGTFMADAARQFAGEVGFWLVLVAGVLSTLSALRSNILAASRVALTMARDWTLPDVLAGVDPERRTPVFAVYASSLALVAILFMVPDLPAAGAAASLIFLLSFALAHVTCLLARSRSEPAARPTFRTPWFPLVPAAGGAACALLAAFQAVSVPAAGGITVVWLGLGALLYKSLFSRRAQAADAYDEAVDPELARLRGRAPLVLVPVANPANAPELVALAAMLAPPRVGRVLLMNTVLPSGGEHGDGVAAAQAVLGSSLRAALDAGHRPEALLSVADSPWQEISRVAREHQVWGVLLGSARLSDDGRVRLEALLDEVDAHVAFLFAPAGFRLSAVRRVLVPIGGRSGHFALRARVLGSLCRDGSREVTWLRVVSPTTDDQALARATRELRALADDATPGQGQVVVKRSEAVRATLLAQAAEADLMVLGLHAVKGARRFGAEIPELVAAASCATLLIARGD